MPLNSDIRSARTAGTLSLLSPAERHRILHEFNATTVAFPHDGLIHGVFEQQVRRTPDATALMGGAERLTFAQLNAKANQIAHALLAQGVRPDDRVGIYAERSIGSVVAMLGVLKAGGGYVPLDPTYPA